MSQEPSSAGIFTVSLKMDTVTSATSQGIQVSRRQTSVARIPPGKDDAVSFERPDDMVITFRKYGAQLVYSTDIFEFD